MSRLTKTITGALGQWPTTVPARARLRATFIYAATDPYAITVEIHTGHKTTRSWMFGRDLLAEGITSAQRLTGRGDVRIGHEITLTDQEVRDEIRFELSSPDGAASLRFPAPPVTAFVDATYHLVPAGHESARIEWDTTLHELTGGMA